MIETTSTDSQGPDELPTRMLTKEIPSSEQTPWLHYAGLVESGEPNSSQKIDEIVYGGSLFASADEATQSEP